MTDAHDPGDSESPAASPLAEASADSGHSPPGAETGSLIAPHLDNSFTETRRMRSDGWTAHARRAFLDSLAEQGTVTGACRAAGMSARAAYNLRNREPLFATAWETAMLLGRRRLADDLLERALSGVVEQIWKDGAIVAERHRYDNRLAVAVLTRLDQRLDRAEQLGQAHVRAAACWDAFACAVAEDRVEDANDLLAPPETATNHELHELNSQNSQFSADSGIDAEREEDGHSIWQTEDGDWVTDYPAPPGFDGYERGLYGDRNFERDCTPGEIALIEADEEADRAGRRAEADRQRNQYFGFAEEEVEAETPPHESVGRGAAEGGEGVLEP